MYENFDIGYDLKMAFEDGYRAGVEVAQPKWISVEDRLPKVEVLAANFAPKTYGYKEYIIGYVSPDWRKGEYYAENDYEILYNVTHWMPLPPPPKEDVKNERFD